MNARKPLGILVMLASLANLAVAGGAEPLDVGSELQLMADPTLVGELGSGARLVLHHPMPQEVSLVMDRPWEGNAVNYMTAFRDGEVFRLYYRGADVQYSKDGYRETHREVTCYAESRDGIHWTKPVLGLFEFEGSRQNNIVWDGLGTHNFTPFKDANPSASGKARYKALGYGEAKSGKGLFAFQSEDAIHWSPMSDSPVITRGAFDSQNLAFWDPVRSEYREYHRDFRDGRDIRTATSKDFAHWTDPEFLDYTPGRISELYTNQIIPYFRAPHLLLGFPTRYVDRGWTRSAEQLPRPDYRRLRGTKSPREGTAITDTMFMTSRDRKRFQVWPESFIRPGLRKTDSWFYGDIYQNWGLLQTRSTIADAPEELSMYVTESTMQERPAYLRRYSLRLDGFVSASAPLAGGEVLTRTLRFSGDRLLLNFSTSAAGSIRIEIQDEGGRPIPGFALAESPEIYGDSIEQPAPWKDDAALRKLSGWSVRLRFVLKDADLYAFRFAK